MVKRFVAKLLIGTALAGALVVGTPSGANADVCFYLWSGGSKPTRWCVWWADR